MKLNPIVIIILLSVFQTSTLLVTGAASADDPVSWTPAGVIDVGDEVTISYDTSATDAVIGSDATQVYMMWGIYIRGNELLQGKTVGATPPSLEMWPEGSELVMPYRFVKTPMVESGDIWSVSFVLNNIPDYVICFFQDENNNRDNNDGQYWLLYTAMNTDRIRVLTPTFAEPLMANNGSSTDIIVNASSSASNWNVILTGVGITLNPTVSSSYDAVNHYWTLSFNLPSIPGLYDMNVSATIGGKERFDYELNSVKTVEEFKSKYRFVVIGDPQIHRDGTAGMAYRNEITGIGNFTIALQEINTINPEFILMLGDVTEWTDEIALMNFKKYVDYFIDNAPMVSIIGNHGDFESTAMTNKHEWGSGQGMWEELIGPTRGIFYYGSHAFIRGDSHSRGYDSENDDGIVNYNHVLDSLDEISTADMKCLMLHHPLSTYGNPSQEVISSSTENQAIVDKLKAIGAEAFFHGHLHVDKYDKDGDLLHIGTTESAGELQGYRVIEVEDNEIIDFSYDTPDLANYMASSYPVEYLNTYYHLDNDGSVTSQLAAIKNCLEKPLTDAHVRFTMQDGETYNVSGGEIIKQYSDNGVKIVDTICNVSANSTAYVYVFTDSPLGVTTMDLPDCPTSTTTTTTTVPEGTSGTDTPGFLGLEILFVLVLIPVITRRKRDNRKR